MSDWQERAWAFHDKLRAEFERAERQDRNQNPGRHDPTWWDLVDLSGSPDSGGEHYRQVSRTGVADAQTGARLVAADLILAHLRATFGLSGENRTPGLDPAGQAAVDRIRRELPETPLPAVVATNMFLAIHAVAALAAALDTDGPDVRMSWPNVDVAAVAQDDGGAVDAAAAELRDGVDVAAEARILAVVDGTDLAIYLAEFTARMYGHVFGSDGLERAENALRSVSGSCSTDAKAP